MKKLVLFILLILTTNLFSQVLTFESSLFPPEEENVVILKKEYNLYKRAYKPEIDGEYKISKIEMIQGSTRATIHFFGQSFPAKYYMYPDTEQTIYLYKVKGLDDFSLTLTRDSGKIRYLYMIPNKGLFTKEPLRDIPNQDVQFLKESGFNETDIENVKNSDRFTVFYTGFVKFN